MVWGLTTELGVRGDGKDIGENWDHYNSINNNKKYTCECEKKNYVDRLNLNIKYQKDLDIILLQAH